MNNKFILLSSQRTGSAFLEECLNSHGGIKCSGEVLIGYGGDYKKMPPKFLKKHRRLRTLWQALFSGAILNPIGTIERSLLTSPDSTVAGFRLMYNQIERDLRVKQYLEKITDVKIILLHRRNILKQFVSLKLMHNQTKYGRYSAHVFEKQNTVKIRIEPSEAVSYINEINMQRKKYRNFFSHLDCLEIYYEEMIGDGGINEATAVFLCSFLNVKNLSLVSSQVKMNSSDLKNIVTNYDELIDFIRESKGVKLSDYNA